MSRLNRHLLFDEASQLHPAAFDATIEPQTMRWITEAFVTSASVFRLRLPNFLMRRHDGFNWKSERLISIGPLHTTRVSCPFPNKYIIAHGDMTKTWRGANTISFREKQSEWDENKDDPAQLKLHPD